MSSWEQKTAWSRRANAISERLHGCRDAERVFGELKVAQSEARADGLIYMESDERIMKSARTIAGGTRIRWS